MSSFTKKTIKITLNLAEGQFSGGNVKIIEGLPVSVGVSKPGGQDMNKLTLDIANLRLDDIEQFITLGFRPLKTYKNIVTVEAGSLGEALDTVFSGEVTTAVPIFSGGGDAVLSIEAQTGSYPNKIASPPVSVSSSASVDELMNQFARDAGYSFVNEGVEGSVKYSLFRGSPIQKAHALAKQVGADLLIDDRTIVIMPKSGHRKGEIPKIDKASGLIGYPSFTNDGIDVKCIYDPRLKIGGLVELKSAVPKASGIWRVSKLDHRLEAYKPSGGAWETTFSATWVGEYG